MDRDCQLSDDVVDRETRRRILSAYLSASLTLGPAYAAFFAFFGAWWSFVAPAAFTAMSVTAWVLKRRNICGWATGLLLSGLWFGPAWAVLTTGGIHSPLVIWLTPTPFMAGALLGRRAAVVVGGISVALVTAIGVLGVGPLPHELAGNALLSVMSGASAVALLTFYGWTTTRNFEDAQREIAAQHAEVAQRNRDMSAILDNVSQGLVLVNVDGVVQPAQSAAMTRWFGRPPPGSFIWDFASMHAPRVGAMLKLGWEELREGVMPAEVVLAQLPQEVKIEGRTYGLRYQPVGEPSAPSAVLIVMSDVTEARQAEEQQARAAETLALFERYVADPVTFASERAELDQLVRSVPTQERATLARRLHTIKGTAAACGLVTLPVVAHRLEDLLESEGRLEPAQLGALTEAWQQVLERTAPWAHAHGDAVLVHEPELAALREAIRRGAAPGVLLAQLSRWKWEHVQSRFEVLANQARGLAQRLGKELRVELDAAGVQVPPQRLDALWLNLVHLVRNAVDHGVERPDVRVAAGKARAGRLSLRAALEGEALRLVIEDDGGGVDWERVRRRARALGLASETTAELEEALFHEGLSTRESVTDVSGRGVGLAALREAVRELGGRMTIAHSSTQGTRWEVSVPLASAQLEAA
ncbi:MAG: ATP-binding protein [Myxococcota bacterium]